MNPLVSVVIPTYKRPELLNRCITALLEQRFAANQYEIIVVDDADSAETLKQVSDWILLAVVQRGLRVRYIPVQGTHGPAAARNVGWRASAAQFIAFTDDDCVPNSGWLRAGVAALQRADAAGGKLFMPIREKPTDYEANAALLSEATFVTANCFCRRAALELTGGFDERFKAAWREDSDLYFSLLSRGLRVINAPEAVVIHPVRPAFWGVSLKQLSKTRFDALLKRKYPALYARFINVQVPWHYYVSFIAFMTTIIGAAQREQNILWISATVWLFLTARFSVIRLRGKTLRPAHVLEMAVTSALIPPLAIFWRIVGALQYRALAV